MENKKIVTCYFDGCCEPKNPGGAMGIGSIVKVNGDIVLRKSEFYPIHQNNTNNIAEYLAFGYILKYLKDNNLDNDNVTIMGDSQLVIKQMNGEYSIKSGAYVKYANRCRELLKEFKIPPVIFWVRREQNSEADALSKGKLDENKIEVRTHSDDKSIITFGKYSGKKINEIEDLNYLEWVYKNVKLKFQVRELIRKQISNIQYLAK